MEKIISLIILIISTNISALTITTNPVLSNAVVKAISLEKAEKYYQAAQQYLYILNMTNQEIKLELLQDKINKGYPLLANAQANRLRCLFFTEEFETEKFKDECLAALKNYKRKPGKEVFTPYIQIYQQLLNYYWSKYEVKKIEIRVFDILDYDSRTFPYVYHFLWKTLEKQVDYAIDTLTQPQYNETLERIHSEIRNYEKTQPLYNPQFQYFKLKLLKAKGKDVFKLSENYLIKNAISENTKKVIELMRESIDYKKPEQIKQYYKLLTLLAVKQPINKDNYKIIGFILKEKKKIEMVAPEVIEN